MLRTSACSGGGSCAELHWGSGDFLIGGFGQQSL